MLFESSTALRTVSEGLEIVNSLLSIGGFQVAAQPVLTARELQGRLFLERHAPKLAGSSVTLIRWPSIDQDSLFRILEPLESLQAGAIVKLRGSSGRTLLLRSAASGLIDARIDLYEQSRKRQLERRESRAEVGYCAALLTALLGPPSQEAARFSAQVGEVLESPQGCELLQGVRISGSVWSYPLKRNRALRVTGLSSRGLDLRQALRRVIAEYPEGDLGIALDLALPLSSAIDLARLGVRVPLVDLETQDARLLLAGGDAQQAHAGTSPACSPEVACAALDEALGGGAAWAAAAWPVRKWRECTCELADKAEEVREDELGLVARKQGDLRLFASIDDRHLDRDLIREALSRQTGIRFGPGR